LVNALAGDATVRFGRTPSKAAPSVDEPKNGPIAVKVINHLGDEVTKMFRE